MILLPKDWTDFKQSWSVEPMTNVIYGVFTELRS